jgi:hypothetical protein
VEDKQHDRLIAKEEAKLEQARAKFDSMKKDAAKKIAGLFKNQDTREIIAADGRDAVLRGRQGAGNQKLVNFAKSHGDFAGGFGLRAIVDDEVITGNEPRYWEMDE